MQLYAVNAVSTWHPREQVAMTTYANLWLYQWL